MARRTLKTIAAAIARNTGGNIPMGEIFEQIANANKEIDGMYEWPWTRAESNIQIQPSYTTGTITITDQTNSFIGTGTTWSTSWQYKRLLLGNMDYLVSSFSSTTAGTLQQTINTGANFVNAPYTIFQDMYPLPADCEFGRILVISNPLFRYKLKYLPVMTLESYTAFSRGMFNSAQYGFSDAGYDDASQTELIRLILPPAAFGELKMIYRRRPPDLTSLASISLLPETFDRCLELLAEYMVRFHRKNPLPGWMELKQAAYQSIQNMRRKTTITVVDNFSSFSAFPWLGAQSASFTDGLAGWIGPTAGSL